MRYNSRARVRLIGRNRQLAALTGTTQHDPDHAVVALITGEPGIGKTRLIDEALRPLENQPLVVRFRSPPASAMSPLVELLDGSELPLPGPSEQASPAALSRWCTRAAATLAGDAARHGRAIVVEDLHWANDVALELIECLAEALVDQRRGRSVLIASSRPVPGNHPVRRVLARLGRLPSATHIELEPLEDVAAYALAAELSPGARRDVLERALRAGGGNPLSIAAALRTLSLRSGRGNLVGRNRRAAVDPSLSDPVDAWISALDDAVRLRLGQIAVVGDGASQSCAAAILGWEEAMIGETMRSGIEVGVLRDDEVFSWGHEHVRRSIIERTPSALVAETHNRCANHWASSSEDAALVASGLHRLAAGHHHEAAGDEAHYLRSAHAAARLLSWDDAHLLFNEALRHLAADANPHDELCAGRAAFFAHDGDAAQVHLLRALDSAVRREDVATQAEALRHLLSVKNTLPLRTDAESIRPAIDRFLSTATEPAMRSQVLQGLAELEIEQRRVDRGIDLAHSALDEAIAAGSRRHEAWARYAIGFAHMTRGDIAATAPETHRALELIARETGPDSEYLRSAVRVRHGIAMLAAGRLKQAERAARLGVEESFDAGEYSGVALGETVIGAVDLLRGDLAAAGEHLDAARDASIRSGYRWAEPLLLPTIVRHRLLLGDRIGAIQEVDAARDVPSKLLQALRHIADPSPTRPWDAAGTGRSWRVAPSLIGAAVLCLEIEELEMSTPSTGCSEVPAAVQDYLDRGMAVAPAWPTAIERVRGTADLLVGDCSEAADHFQRSRSWAQRVGARTELALCALGLARVELLRPGGSLSTARRWATTGLHEAERIGATTLLERLRSLAGAGAELRGRVEQRTGTWRVVLVSDIVESTRISRELGDEHYLEVVRTHHRIVREAVESHGGAVFGDAGDGLLAWFSSTTEALAAADAALRRSAADPVAPLDVRIGLAGGDPLFADGRPNGVVVNRAARLSAVGPPNRIVVDQPVLDDGAGAVHVSAAECRDLKGLESTAVYVLEPAPRCTDATA